MEFMKKLDFLSPPITLNFKGEDHHPSIFSAILTIIIYILVFIAAIHYFLGFVNKDSPKTFFSQDILKMQEICLLILHQSLTMFSL